MKATVTEYEGFYHVDLTPENPQEVCALVQLQLNATKRIRDLDTYPSKAHGVASTLVVTRRKRERYTIT